MTLSHKKYLYQWLMAGTSRVTHLHSLIIKERVDGCVARFIIRLVHCYPELGPDQKCVACQGEFNIYDYGTFVLMVLYLVLKSTAMLPMKSGI